MEKQKETILTKLARISFVLAGIILFGYLVYIGVSKNVEVKQKRESEGYIQIEDYSYRKYADSNAPVFVREEYTFQVREYLKHDEYLAFYVYHKYVDVYVDDEPIYSLRPSDEIPNIETPGSNWVHIPLYREDADKEIRVVLTPIYENVPDEEVEFLLGSELSIYAKQFKTELPQLLVSGLAVIIGVLFWGVAIYNALSKKKRKGLGSIGGFAICLGLWRLTDTKFSPLFVEGKPVLLFYISVTMLMIGGVPLMYSIAERYDHKKRKKFERCILGACVICIIQLIVQILGIFDLRETLYITHGVIITIVLVTFSDMVFEPKEFLEEYQQWWNKNILWLVITGVFVDLITYYVTGTSLGLLFTLCAFLVFIISKGMDFISYYNEREKKLAEVESQLVQSRIMTMMSQIRSHFVFNILNAISGMCKYDPEKADRTIVCFARYLRTNINIMQEDQLVPFLTALRHLEDYVSLEQIRFGDKLQFSTDIDIDDFMIPPLILQPIVENAIKHGLMPKSSGGEIVLRTKLVGNKISVSIEDNGVGFDNTALEKEKSVGLKNVRIRLEHMIQGEMKIESNPGHGTTITILMPYEEEQRCM